MERFRKERNNIVKVMAMLALSMALCVGLGGCGLLGFSSGSGGDGSGSGDGSAGAGQSSGSTQEAAASQFGQATKDTGAPLIEPPTMQKAKVKFIPEWNGSPYCYVNGNKPRFKKEELTTASSEYLGPLDDQGRCTVCMACIGADGMPEGERGAIYTVHPTGWHSDQYDFVDGGNLYNRCHLIGWQLTGDDAIARNLITGTRYMNVEGMLPFENVIAGYVKNTGNHVMYRVRPLFGKKEMVARGVQLEAWSVEDEGRGVCFNVFCFNLQPGVDIDYKTGDNRKSGNTASLALYQDILGHKAFLADPITRLPEKASKAGAEEFTYILNANTGVFHNPGCKSVADMSERNKQNVTASREELINQGYRPCGNCKP